MTENSIEGKVTMNSEEMKTIDETGVKQIGELLEMEGRSDMAKIVANLYHSYEKHNEVCFLFLMLIQEIT